MQKYREMLPFGRSGRSEGGRVGECDSWEEIARLVEEAKGEYKRQGNNPIRKIGRTVGEVGVGEDFIPRYSHNTPPSPETFTRSRNC